MSEQPHDHRLISGAVIAAEIWFEVELADARTFGRDAVSELGCVSLECRLKPLRDLRLEGAVKALTQLNGALYLTSQRERTQRLGTFNRERDGYSARINLFEPEMDRVLALLASGLRPRTLRLEFDIEVPEWFEVGEYWDDVRYPYVHIHEHVIEWGLGDASAEKPR